MFFIGGFSTVLPYIIYISLLWIFILVGFKGKIAYDSIIKEQPEKIIQSPGDVLLLPESTFIIESHNKESNSEIAANTTHQFFQFTSRPEQVAAKLPPGIIYRQLLLPSAISRRGPPAQIS